MWETMTDDIEALGGKVLLNTPVEKLVVEDGRVQKVIAGGKEYESNYVISSLPLRNVVGMADPHPKPEVASAAKGIRYRDFLTVSLVLDGEDLFPDNWIYIHDPEVKVGRIQNFRSWSPWMVPDHTKACVGLEYFCFAGDELWEMDDDKLIELGMRELEQLGLAKRTSSSSASRPACRRPTRCTTPTTPSASPPSAAGSTASRTSSRSAATGCTATTTRTTPCSPPCARWTTS